MGGEHLVVGEEWNKRVNQGWLLTVRTRDLTVRRAMLHLGYVCE